MIGNDVDHHIHVPIVESRNEGLEIIGRSIFGIETIAVRRLVYLGKKDL